MSTDVVPRRLAALADEIRAELDAMEVAAQTALERAVSAGERLIEAKSLVAHGEWEPWLDEHFPLSRRWARRCMRLARSVRDGELQNGLTGPFWQALEQIAEPKPATNLFGEPDSRMQENGDGWRDRLRAEHGIDGPEPENPDPGAEEAPAGHDEPHVEPEPGASTSGEVLDEPLAEARKRYSAAASRAFRDNDKASARQALAVWRHEVRPALERVARDGIEIDRSRWRR
jgi:Protein of unknown function (DUF3102)